VRLTEREFQEAARLIAAMGQKTTASAQRGGTDGGFARRLALVCLLNNARWRPDRNAG
jgi:catechol 1,2-dioxygenase